MTRKFIKVQHRKKQCGKKNQNVDKMKRDGKNRRKTKNENISKEE